MSFIFPLMCHLRVCKADSEPVDFGEQRGHQSVWFSQPDPEVRSQVCGLQVSLSLPSASKSSSRLRREAVADFSVFVSWQSTGRTGVPALLIGRPSQRGEQSDCQPQDVHPGLWPPCVSLQPPIGPNRSLVTCSSALSDSMRVWGGVQIKSGLNFKSFQVFNESKPRSG